MSAVPRLHLHFYKKLWFKQFNPVSPTPIIYCESVACGFENYNYDIFSQN